MSNQRVSINWALLVVVFVYSRRTCIRFSLKSLNFHTKLDSLIPINFIIISLCISLRLILIYNYNIRHAHSFRIEFKVSSVGYLLFRLHPSNSIFLVLVQVRCRFVSWPLEFVRSLLTSLSHSTTIAIV